MINNSIEGHGTATDHYRDGLRRRIARAIRASGAAPAPYKQWADLQGADYRTVEIRAFDRRGTDQKDRPVLLTSAGSRE